jgi:formylglycine-generating enzyme required for sulfatase activity
MLCALLTAICMLAPWVLPATARAADAQVFRDCDVCPEMVRIPAGHFFMGSSEGEYARKPDESPRHEVTVPAFAAGRFPVTFAEWDACVDDGGCRGYRPNDGGWGHGRLPVINVGWHDAQAYAAWLTRKTGHAYRLLTEAEWEYAARAGTTTAFYTGPCIDTRQANYDGSFAFDGCATNTGVARGRTTPVGSFEPNRFGLYDMAGNVYQWVEDPYADDYASAPADGSAATKGAPGGRRVLRGGSWYGNPHWMRSAYREGYQPEKKDSDIGFRIARGL